jgi:carbamoyl-phosphate synthase large subunit
MSTDQVHALVSAVGGFGHGEQILKALRCAPPERYRLFGADMAANCPQFALVEEAHTLPRADAPDYLDALIALCKKLHIKALFHGCEADLKVMSRHRETLRNEGLFLPINPARVIDLCMNKSHTSAFLAEHGFNPPGLHIVDGRESIDAVDMFPVIVKPSIGGGGSAHCYIAQSRDELAGIHRLFEDDFRQCRLMVQEYVGTPEDEYTVGVLHDLDGAFINSIAVRRKLDSQLNVRMVVPNRTGRTDLGPRLVVSSGISHGEVGTFPEVTRQCEKIAKALGAAGPINIQCRFAEGQVRVFEINPRFSGTTSVRAMMGYNEPDILVRRHLLGEEIPPRFPYRTGTVIRTLLETELSDATAAHS